MSGGEAVDWLPAIAVLVAGIFGGLTVMLMSRGRRGELTSEAESESLEDLEQQLDPLIERLRAMRDSGDEVTRTQVETDAAGILRKIEERLAGSSAKEAGEPGVDDRRPGLRGFLWGAGATVVIGSIVLFVASSATERGQDGLLTGGAGTTAAPQQQPPQIPPQLANLEQFVAQNPDDLEARLELARIYIMQQEMMKVWEQTNYVLERVPDHPRAKGYQAVVRLAMGQTAMAFQMLEEAIAADPELLEARIHLALAYLQTGRPQEAVRTLEDAKEIHPAQAAILDELVGEILAQWPEVRTEN